MRNEAELNPCQNVAETTISNRNLKKSKIVSGRFSPNKAYHRVERNEFGPDQEEIQQEARIHFQTTKYQDG